MKLKKKLLSLLLIVLLLVQLLPSVAFAGKWSPDGSESDTKDDFISSMHSEQFIIGKDSNSFMHYYDHFSVDNYPISEKYLNQLLSLGSYSNQCRIINKIRSKWTGSCFGIASTMALNRLAEQNYGNKKLNIAEFQPGVQYYFSLGIPRTHPPVLDMINYYMLTQFLDKMYDSGTYVRLSQLNLDQSALNNFVSRAKTEIDNGRCYFICYYTSHGGHAIVGTDYYEYTDSNGKNNIILKYFDENSRRGGSGYDYDTFSYIHLIKNTPGSYTSPYTNNSAPEFRFFAYDRSNDNDYSVLSAMLFVDIADFNEYVSIDAPAAPSPATNSVPMLQFSNIENTYQNYSVKPFTGNLSSPVYVDNYGVFAKPDSLLPCLVNVLNQGYFFPHMDIAKFRFTQSSPNDPSLSQTDVAVALNIAYSGVPFAGYDICSSDGTVSNYSMSYDAGVDSGNFAYISGKDIKHSRFDGSAKLRMIETYGTDGVQNDLGVLVGSKGADGNYDMFLLTMKKAQYLELYDESNSPFEDSILLHSDGFPNDFNFVFFKGSAQSPEYPNGFYSDDPNDKWVKLTSKVGSDGVVEVSVYSASEPTSGTWPSFRSVPDWTTRIAKPLVSASSGSSGGGVRNQYQLAEGAEELSYSSGDLKFTVNAPFEKYVSTSMDGVMIERRFVTVENGSTIITVSRDFMSTLKEGTHVVRVQFTDGYMQTMLKVGAASAVQSVAVPDVPATGAPFSHAFALIAAALICSALALPCKRRSNIK